MSESEWNGEGLPPVGVECKFNTGGDATYKKCFIAGYHARTGRPIVDHYRIGSELTHAPQCWNFRPLQSHRDRVIEKALGCADQEDLLGSYEKSLLARFAKGLHDAGMLVDSQPKRMSRAEADKAFCGVRWLPNEVRSMILDALGFVEDGK